jgi:hypothetical protein
MSRERAKACLSYHGYVERINERLMLLDNEDFGIGWAAYNAQLHDEVFLIPDCSVPVILRQRQDDTYHLVGDADLVGTKEVWEKTKAEDLMNVKIV